MQVELRPHIGKHCATGRQVDLGQDRIFVDGFHLGYVGRQPDAPINLIYPDVPEDQQQAIREAVRAKYGGQAERIAAPPVMPEDEGDEDQLADE